jgi:hypothetical protein
MKPPPDAEQPATKDKLIALGREANGSVKKGGMTRKGFGELLKRAFNPGAAKPDPKVP